MEALQNWFRDGNVDIERLGEGSLSGGDGRVGIGLLLIIRGPVSCLDGGITSCLGKDGGLARRSEEGGEVLIDGGKILLKILDECVQLIFVSLNVITRFGGIDAMMIAAASSG